MLPINSTELIMPDVLTPDVSVNALTTLAQCIKFRTVDGR